MGASKRKPEPTWPSSHLRTTWLHRCPAGMTVAALSSPTSCLGPLLRIGAGSAKSRPSSDAAMRAVSSSLPPLARMPRVRAKSTSSVLSQYQRWNSSEERPGTRSGRDDAGRVIRPAPLDSGEPRPDHWRTRAMTHHASPSGVSIRGLRCA
ncbi:hypothetical protein SDC9_174446 [bioreactor metagenome]|uniref:Uncharacterized protein n=1 Tax=bioreactor metagenome TaxID=1076179 RepID=A0A645GMB9_9ZZZZ